MNGISGNYGIYEQNAFLQESMKKATASRDKKAEKDSKKFGMDPAAEYIPSGKAEEAEKAAKSEKSLGTKNQVQLSQAAVKLLQELKKQYGNADIFVGNYENDYEAQKYLSQGTKEFSILIEPELLEKMAADESVKEKYMGIIEDSTQKLADMMSELGDDADTIDKIGFTVKEDGSIKYFAELSKSSEAQRERIEKAHEKKAEEAKNAEKKLTEKKEAEKRTKVEADSVEELMDAIKNIDWDSIEATKKYGWQKNDPAEATLNFSI